jgi:hypothetical protein
MTAKPPRVRKNVSLTSEDLEDLTALKVGDSNKAKAFAELTGLHIGARTSEAEVLHGLIELGRCLVKDRELDLAYRRAAEVDAVDPERQKWRSCMRSHRRMRHLAEGEGS